MNKVEIADRFADMFKKSRNDAGKSQEYMAKALGVSKKTIQNWEMGMSCPTQRQGFEWFEALGLQPLPYYLEVLYPIYKDEPTDQEIDESLISLITDLPTDVKRKILFIAKGEHGSSPLAILEMIVVHLHLPLKLRLATAISIATNYEVAESVGALIETDIEPNRELLEKAFTVAKENSKQGKRGYSVGEY